MEKRKRGRPPKNSNIQIQPPPPKKRGRPPKNLTVQIQPPTPKKRGRPPKNTSLSDIPSIPKEKNEKITIRSKFSKWIEKYRNYYELWVDGKLHRSFNLFCIDVEDPIKIITPSHKKDGWVLLKKEDRYLFYNFYSKEAREFDKSRHKVGSTIIFPN